MNEPFTRPFPFSPANMENFCPVGEWDEIQETMMVGLRLTPWGCLPKGFFSSVLVNRLSLFYALEVQQLIETGFYWFYAGEKEDILRLSKKAPFARAIRFLCSFLKD